MKNKEIEELLDELKDVAERHTIEIREYGAVEAIPQSISKELRLNSYSANLLLSYIEQLEKRNKQIYEGFMATQEELTDYATENEQLENENQQLKKQKDDVVKLIYKKMRDVDIYGTQTFDLDELLRMLGEIDE